MIQQTAAPSARGASDEPQILACAELTARNGTRCGLPVEVRDRYALLSTDGPVEHVRTRSVAGHSLNCPIEYFR